MKNLVKSSILIGGTELGVVVISVFRAKYLAVKIGPDGLGMYSLLNSFFLLLTAFCAGWFSQAYIKYVAEYHRENDVKKIKSIHDFTFTFSCILLLITSILLFVFKDFIKYNFLSKEVLDFYFAIFTATFIVNSLQSIYGYYLNATLQTRLTARSRLLSSLFDFVTLIILVFCFNIIGFFISLLTTSLFTLFIFFISSNKTIKTNFRIGSLKDETTPNIIKYGSFNVVLLIINNFSQYLYRLIISKNLNLVSVGLFHAISSLVGYIGIVNRGTNFSYVPTMSQNISNEERNVALNDYLRVNIITGIFICSCAILFCNQVIAILYTKEFNGISQFSHVFIISQFISLFVVAFQSIVIGMNHYKAHSLVVLGTNVLWIGIPLLIIKQTGVASIAIGSMAASLWSIVFNYFYLRRIMPIIISRRVLFSILFSVVILWSSIIIRNFSLGYKVIFLLIECPMLFILLSKTERKNMLDRIKNKIGKWAN